MSLPAIAAALSEMLATENGICCSDVDVPRKMSSIERPTRVASAHAASKVRDLRRSATSTQSFENNATRSASPSGSTSMPE